jgi:hypothetical protein
MIEALGTLAYRLERPHSPHIDEAAAKHLREAAAAIAGLRESNDRWAEINSEQNTRIASLETTIRTMHYLIGQGALGKAQVIAREALATGECPTCGDDCSARTVTLPDGTIADCSEPKPAPKGKGWMADLFAAHPPPKLGDEE